MDEIDRSTIDELLASDEPSIRWRARVAVLGEDSGSRPLRALCEEIRTSPRVATLLDGRDSRGRLLRGSVYAGWQGAHWTLAALADLGYPPGDDSLSPMRDQLQDTWLAVDYLREREITSRGNVQRSGPIPLIAGRYRAHASQHGNALLSIVALGLADARTTQLAERLEHWQWPDGGWNCDLDPAATSSSLMETLLPMRGLHLFGAATDDRAARAAAARATEVFLSRRMFRRRSSGSVIRAGMVKLHYPLYWHYDYLAGLRGLAELGRLGDPRTADALELLRSKRLPDGGWPAEAAYYKAVRPDVVTAGSDPVGWGGTSSRRANPWVTVLALEVLAAAERV